MRLLNLLLLLFALLTASLLSKENPDLEDMVGQMIMSGFRGSDAQSAPSVIRDISKYSLGGVILFNYDVLLNSHDRNILSPSQLKQLTAELSSHASQPLFIAVDQEGGSVARLNEANGFFSTLSHGVLGEANDLSKTEEQGNIIGKMLSEHGININFAPVVDLNSNPENPVIGKINRSFSDDADQVVNHSLAYINGMNEYGIINCLKHFPGHGSSHDDSHMGVTDITKTWSSDELIPYQKLIADKKADMVMIGHLINRRLDQQLPATLSKTVIQNLLRDELQYQGVIISDDLGMKAITDQFTMEETVLSAIQAGIDILLFGNNLEYDEDIVPTVHQIIMALIAEGKVPIERIKASYMRIMQLKERLEVE